MKYIRSKDGIWKYDQENNFAERPNKDFKCTELKLRIKQEDIIKQADTIEELCDEFVYEYQTGIRVINKKIIAMPDIVKTYGAIWTDKGLIYVAKMNEKEEMELL